MFTNVDAIIAAHGWNIHFKAVTMEISNLLMNDGTIGIGL